MHHTCNLLVVVVVVMGDGGDSDGDGRDADVCNGDGHGDGSDGRNVGCERCGAVLAVNDLGVAVAVVESSPKTGYPSRRPMASTSNAQQSRTRYRQAGATAIMLHRGEQPDA